jgi:hypothetical protein
VPARWNCYPWDAAAYGRGIEEHEELARRCAARPARWSTGALTAAVASGVAIGAVLSAAFVKAG